MSRPLRYVQDGGSLVEVTCRTLQNRFLLLPQKQLNEIVAGVLGRAQRRYKVRCCFYAFLSTHYHLLLDVDDAHQLARFMGYFNSNLAREVARLVGWRDKIWARRYQAILVSGEDGAQIARLKYLLGHGAKEDLVERPQDWPGVHAARALVEDADLQGYWFDRTQEYAARQRGEDFDRLQYATIETVHLSPLPCWKHLPDERWKKLTLNLLREVEEETAIRRARTGKKPLGVAAILAQQPFDRPERPKRSPAPLFHVVSSKVRQTLWEAYAGFVAAFRTASEKLRAGDRGAVFPCGSFPPALPFVSG